MTITNMNKNYRSIPIQLAEVAPGSEFPKEVQVLKTGSFKDPRYGKFDITLKMLNEMVSNFKSGIRGVKPAIDFKHESEAEAAAWMLDVFTKPGKKKGEVELWVSPDWTGAGCKSLSDRTYGYLSADFSQNYQDNEEGKFHGAVLLGAALTNRPVIKNMSPVIQLSEGDSMPEITPEQLAQLAALMKQLGVNSVEEMIAAIAKMKPEAELAEKESELGSAKMQLSESSTKLSEALAKVATLEGEKVLSEKEKTFNVMLSEGRAIPAQKESFIAGDLMKFAELAPVGGVKIAEKGTEGNGPADLNPDLAEDDKTLKLAEEKVSKGEAKTLPEAITLVLREQKVSK